MKNIICEKCRKPVAISDRFCGHCGSKFLGDAEKVLFPVEGKWGWTLDLVGDLWFEVRGGKITLSNWDEGKSEGGTVEFSIDVSPEERQDLIVSAGGPHGVSTWEGVPFSFKEYLLV